MKAWAIALKELKTFFQSPVAYIVLFVTVSVFNVFFYIIIDQNAEATLRDIFKVMEFMFVFIVPLLTMRSFAEERASGTFEFLATAPVTRLELVLGKFAGVAVFFLFLMALTAPYYFIIDYYADPDVPAMLTGYFGILLEGLMFIAIGLWTSSMTRNQIVAAITSYVVIFMLYFSVSFKQYFSGIAETFIVHVSVWSHTENFIVGIINTMDVAYFLLGTALSLIWTRLNLAGR